MKNKDDYGPAIWVPGGSESWTGENCVCYGHDATGRSQFRGLGLDDLDESGMRQELKSGYETDCEPHTVSNPATEIRWTRIGRILTGE